MNLVTEVETTVKSSESSVGFDNKDQRTSDHCVCFHRTKHFVDNSTKNSPNTQLNQRMNKGIAASSQTEVNKLMG